MAERGNYRSIATALLSGKDFRRLAATQRWVFMVLKMNLSGVGIDVWYTEELVSRLAEESGYTTDQVRLSLDILEHEGWVKREDNVIWAVGQLAFDPHMKPADPKHRKSVQRHVAGLPRMGLVRQFVEAHPDFFPASEGHSMGLGWAFDAPSRKSRRPKKGPPKQEKEKEKEKDLPAVAEGKSISWPNQASEWLSENHKPTEPAQAGGMLKKIVDAKGWPETLEGMKLQHQIEPDKPFSWFLSKPYYWIDLAKQPTVDPISREFTEKGRLALSS